ncbi:MAG: hypothetical protein MUC84_07420 [Solirubrobacteraceae bacterium]|nr:hypothetical protein [Solirubrobacteraceae bacterium]
MARRRRNPISKLLGDLGDDARGFAGDLTARARDAEEHAHDAVRHAVDGDGERRSADDRREIEELSDALAALTLKVNRLAAAQDEAGEGTPR